MTDPAEVFRVLNGALSLYILAQAVRPRTIRWWRERGMETRFLLLGMLALAFASGWSSLETLIHGIPSGPRVLINTVALAWCAIGVTLATRKE